MFLEATPPTGIVLCGPQLHFVRSTWKEGPSRIQGRFGYTDCFVPSTWFLLPSYQLWHQPTIKWRNFCHLSVLIHFFLLDVLPSQSKIADGNWELPKAEPFVPFTHWPCPFCRKILHKCSFASSSARGVDERQSAIATHIVGGTVLVFPFFHSD